MRTKTILPSLALTLAITTHASAQDYTVIDLTPGGYVDASVSGGNAAAGNQFIGYANTAANSHAILWTGTSGTFTDLHPATGFSSTFGSATDGFHQVGSGSGSATSGHTHALLWSGAANTYIDLNPAGVTSSFALGVSGNQQVGATDADGVSPHALLWTGSANSAIDINPVGFSNSVAWATNGTQQVGNAQISNINYHDHAILWNGSPSNFVDLTPQGAIEANALGIYGNQQVGLVDDDAALWSGTAQSFVNLHPNLPGIVASIAYATNGIQQVGGGYGPADEDQDSPEFAFVWSGTADSAINLQQFLPADTVGSEARGIDENGNIFGSAYFDGYAHAILWIPIPDSVPEPHSLALLSLAITALLHRRHPRS